MQIPELDYTKAPNNNYIWLISNYAKVYCAKIKCSVPKNDYIAPDEAHKHFNCPDGYKPFRGAKVNFAQKKSNSESASERRLRAYDFFEAWPQILILFKTKYWMSFIRTKTEIKEIEYYYNHVSKLLQGYCLQKFFSMFALVVKYLFEDKERIRINNWSILEKVENKYYDSNKFKFTFYFKEKFFWSKHVGGYIELFPPDEAQDADYDHAEALSFLGSKFGLFFFCVCLFVLFECHLAIVCFCCLN